MYYFDARGFLTDSALSDRCTVEVPPDCGKEPAAGKPWPNCYGQNLGWTTLAWTDPPINNSALIATIKAELASIDKQSQDPRTVRETLLGNVVWMAKLDAQAETLRKQLGELK